MTAAAARPAPIGLRASAGGLVDDYDLLLVDLDGTVYVGDRPIDGAATALTFARECGNEVVFVTNNASRTPAAVAEALTGMGVDARASEVMTSAVAAAGILASELDPGAAVLVVGGVGVREALLGVGLRPVDQAGDETAEHPVAVLQGFAPDVGWRSLAEATVAIRDGAQWTATNADVTLPSARGPLPGNGSLVAALAAATGLRPRVVGKPERALIDAALDTHHDRRPLVIGDRLDTDIAGARNAGLPSLLVLSGVSHARDLLGAPPDLRPDYIGSDLRALLVEHPAASYEDGLARSGGATARVETGVVALGRTTAPASPDGLDELRALAVLAWATAGEDGDSATSRSSWHMYDAALRELGLN